METIEPYLPQEVANVWRLLEGVANVEEDFTDSAVGQRVQPFRIEDEARQRGANYVQAGLFKRSLCETTS